MDMLCPKCHNLMKQYERNGVVVDQCTECKGLFLDRGELERLTAAEQAWHSGRHADYDERHPGGHRDGNRDDHGDRWRAGDRHDDRYRDRHDDHHRGYDKHRRGHRRRSLFEDLFDFD